MHILYSDLDGSLHHPQQGFHPENIALLHQLDPAHTLRVIATGRSLYSARLLLNEDFPVDYLIFSSGAGIMRWSDQHLIRRRHLSTNDVETLFTLFNHHQLDFFLHGEVPDNHYFWHHCHSKHNADFEARRLLYADLGKPFCHKLLSSERWETKQLCSQAIVFVSQEQTLACEEQLKKALPHLSIIRSTSPLDQKSGWLEIFPGDVSKSQSAQWLKDHKAYTGRTLALGNDYNDRDLLHWADYGFVVQSAPEDLKTHLIEVSDPDGGSLSEAVRHFERLTTAEASKVS